MKKLLLSLFAVVATTFASIAEDTLAYTCTFDRANFDKKVSSYTSSWTTTCNGNTWDIVNFNNNNSGWDYIKCGSKSAASIATITTAFAAPEKISKVVVTIDAITASSVNSITLQHSTESDFTNAESETVEFKTATGAQAVELTNPTAGLYYRLVFDCKKGSGNGLVQVSKIEYYAAQDTPVPDNKEKTTLTWTPKSNTLAIGDEFTAPTLTRPNDAIVEYKSDNSALLSVDSATGEMTFTPGVTGTAKVTAQVSADDPKYSSDPATYTLTVSKKDVTLSFEQNKYTAEIGNEFQSPALTVNPEAARSEVTFTSSNTAVATVSSDGTIEILDAGATTITATIKNSDTYKDATAKYTLQVTDPNDPYDKIVFSALGYTNGQAITKEEHGIVIITLAKGTNKSNAPTYYDSGTAVRVYAGNTMTVAVPEEYILTKIESEYASGTNAVTADPGNFTDDETYTTWTPSKRTNSVVFTVGGTSGNRAWKSITVHYELAANQPKENVTLTFDSESMNVEFEEGAQVQGLVAKASAEGLTITYSSDDESVATVDANGMLTLRGIGSTQITAKTEETLHYYKAETYYTVNVTPKALGDIMANSQVIADNDKKEVELDTPVIFSANNAEKISYSITDGYDYNDNKSADADGIQWDAPSAGEFIATVTAELSGSAPKKVTILINVTAPKQTPSLTFSPTSVSIKEGEAFTAPVLTTDPEGLEVTYTSSNEAVATVDDNGILTLTGIGTTIITANFAGNTDYYPASATYTLTVIPNSSTVTFDFNSAKQDVYGFTSTTNSNTYEQKVKHIEEGIVCIDFNKDNETGKYRLWGNDWTLRIMSGASMTVSVPDDYYITNITFNGISTALSTTEGNYVSSNSTGTTEGKWNPTDGKELSQVKFTRGSTGKAEIKTIKVTYSKKSPTAIRAITVNDPVEDKETLDVSVYYVLHVKNHVEGYTYTVQLALIDDEGNALSEPVTITDHSLYNGDFVSVAPRRVSHELTGGASDRLQGMATFHEAKHSTKLETVSVKYAINDAELSEEQTVKFDKPITTGIVELNAADGVNEAEWYDLSGRRVASPAKGVYIMKQGSKVSKRAF